MMDYDSAIVTAFRGDPFDGSRCVDMSEVGEGEGKVFDTNKLRNRDLKATLLSLGYGVTRVDGSYIEGFETPEAYEVAEESFFVTNLEGDTNFFEQIIALGEKFCQDSVMIIPQGAPRAYLHGTNNSEFPGYGQKIDVGSPTYGREKEFMTKVRGRPLAFTEKLETYKSLSRMERMAVRAIAKKVLTD